MSTPPATAAPDPKAGMAGKLFLFRQNAAKHGMASEEVEAAVNSFETAADVDTALAFWRETDNKAPEKKEEPKKAEKAKLALNKGASVPPEQLPGSQSTDEKPLPRFNTKSIRHVENMFASGTLKAGACPAFRYNPETKTEEVL